MKKKQMKIPVCKINEYKKSLLAMRLTLLLIFGFIFCGYGNTFSQYTITLISENTTYKELFQEIRKQTGCIVLYHDNVLNKKEKIKTDFVDVALEKVLEEILSKKGLTYEKNGEYILVVKQTKSQQNSIVVDGTIKDKDGYALPGVTIKVKGTSYGVVTDNSGYFKIEIQDDRSIEFEFSFVGMKTQVIKYSGQRTINLVMEEDVEEIGEVVVTGYQKVERRSLTSSVTTIDMDDLKSVNQPNLEKLLQGQVPGMTIMNLSGAPGAVPQIRIRGTSTLSGNVQPLWVVDGIILEDPIDVSMDDLLTNRNLIASGVGGVNVDDIESINILKDAAATAIYGTRAANGVIVLTSRKGKAGKTRVSFNSSINVGIRPKIKDAYMMNSKQRIEVTREQIEKGFYTLSSGSTGSYIEASDFDKYLLGVYDRKLNWNQFEDKVRELEEVNTDWFKYLFRNSVSNRQSLSVSGGDERTNFYMSASYNNEQATAKKVGMETYIASIRVAHKLLNNVRVLGDIELHMRDNKSFFSMDSRANPYETALLTTRAHRAYDENGNRNDFTYDSQRLSPLEIMETGWRKSKNFGFRTRFDIEWRITQDLTYSTLISFNRENTNEVNLATDESFFVRSRKAKYDNIVNGGIVRVWHEGGYRRSLNSNVRSLTYRNQVSWMPMFANDHRFDIMVGQEIRKNITEGENMTVYGYSHNKGHQQILQWDLLQKLNEKFWTESYNESAFSSWYASAGYTYRNRYTVSFNGRTDGSNRFGTKTNKVFQPLWAVGLNYQLKEEPFLYDVQWLDYLTLRGSYGSQGNVASQAYSKLVATNNYDETKQENYLTISAPKNPNLKWEKNYTVNLALDFSLFNRRVRTIIEYYNKKAVDLLGSKQVSQVSGFSSVQVNWASMRNVGYEFSLNTLPINSKDFRWASNLNFGYNKNKVLDVYSTPSYYDLTNAKRTNFAGSAVVGKPINGLWSYRYAGLNEEGFATFYNNEFDEHGNETIALKNITDIDALEYSGTTQPKVQGGFTNTFYYKEFTLSALFVGSFGNVVRRRFLHSEWAYIFPTPNQNLDREFVNRWRTPGDENHTDIPRLMVKTSEWENRYNGNPGNAAMYNNSNIRTVKGDFVRFQNLSLSYNLYSDKLRELGIRNITLMIQGNNLYVWKNSKLKGQDPEAQGSNMNYTWLNQASVAINNTYLPLSRTYLFSLSVQF